MCQQRIGELIFDQSWEKNQTKYLKSLKKKVSQGSCIIFNKGERLLIQESDADLIRVQKKGSSKLYWTGGHVLPEVLGRPMVDVVEYNREMERRKTKK